jgi:leucyl-tRNA synthetase
MATKSFSREQRVQLITRARHMRNHPTTAEATLWEKLRAKQLHDFKFRRQHIIPPFIVDFYCAEKKLIIEVDGAAHNHLHQYDQQREEILLKQEYIILRFTNDQVLEGLDYVLSAIINYLQ